MGRGRAVLLTVLLSLLVAAGAVGTSAYLRYQRAARPAPPPPSSTSAPPPTLVTCHVDPCSVMVATIIGSTKIELIADAGGQSGRLRVGEDRLFESRITEKGVVLSPRSLVCVVGPPAACMIRGEADGMLYGEVVQGRSGKWAMGTILYVANGGYLSLANVDGDTAPEVVAVQRGYFTQVWGLDGEDLGCTPPVSRPERLAGWPDDVKPDRRDLRKPCP